MHLLTHNFLRCHKRGVVNGYPLLIRPTIIEYKEAGYNLDFVRGLLPKLRWQAFRAGVECLRPCKQVLGIHAFEKAGGWPGLPHDLPEKCDDALLRQMRILLLDVQLKEGTLVCPESGREFAVVNSIPDMRLRDEEL
eukprot:TRINITY_DN112974_c0_g1_i1.p1 TRINITY_DN112974_c0_g1~~TRINITY_DN112974_c0_g1_i1.p1  ORF type:complete len:137 (+),score=26.20 TRINITY_DN112974_c0_g1_i1:43-453(+)